MKARIRLASLGDLDQLAELRQELWPDPAPEKVARELRAMLAGEPVTTLPLVIFVAELDSALVGFIEVDLRSHADGCDPRVPVGFIEGWFVRETHRRQGVGAQLVAAAEEWARGKGCAEMASDTWIDNESSQRVHEALGFEVVDRCVHYRKTL